MCYLHLSSNSKMTLSSFCLGILLSYTILCKNVVHCELPEEPIKCSFGNSDCVITNSYGSFSDRSTCRAADAVYPENEDRLISYVRDATMMKRKIKVFSRLWLLFASWFLLKSWTMHDTNPIFPDIVYKWWESQRIEQVYNL